MGDNVLGVLSLPQPRPQILGLENIILAINKNHITAT
jgi:hypothetical protein